MLLPSLMLAASSSIGAAAIQSFASVTNDTHGVWWVTRGQLDPPSLALGVTAVQYAGMTDARTHVSRYKQANDRRFGSNHSRWADASVSLLRRLGFNTVGPWSDQVVNAAAGRRQQRQRQERGHGRQRLRGHRAWSVLPIGAGVGMQS